LLAFCPNNIKSFVSLISSRLTCHSPGLTCCANLYDFAFSIYT
jgi:hypothetical protein